MSTRYGTVEVDPPWKFKAPGGMHGANGRKGTRPTYRTMSLAELLVWRLPVEVADQAHLWVWTTNAHVSHVDRLIEAWGFRPTGCMRTWVKTRPTCGYWTQGDTEHVRLGVRGRAFRNPPRVVRATLGYTPRNSFTAPRGPGGHSSKPDRFYFETRAISPGPHASLFQRTPRVGWDGFGDEYEEHAARAAS